MSDRYGTLIGTHARPRRRARAGCWLAVVLTVLATGCGAPDPTLPPEPARVSAEKLRVSHQAKDAAAIELPAQTARAVAAEDRIVVHESGEALLRFRDFLTVRIFHDSRLVAGCDPTASPAECYTLEAGATFNTLTPDQAARQRLTIETDGGAVVIQNTGTRYLVAYDAAARLTWLVVAEGSARVRAAGQEVTVSARQQTWVEPSQPPRAPQPASRAIVGGRWPPIGQLTAGAFSDADLLPVTAAMATTAPAPPTVTATRAAAPATTVTPTQTPAAAPSHTPTAQTGAAGSEVIAAGHTVFSVVFTPDGRTLATGGIGARVTLWDVPARTLARTLREPRGGLFSVAVAPNGRLIAGVYANNSVGVWEAASGALLRVVDDLPAVEDLAFAPDSTAFAAVSGGAVHLVEVATGRRVRTYREPNLLASSIAFDPRGSVLAAGMAPDGAGSGAIVLWETATGKVVRVLSGGHVLRVADIAFSADGRRLASVSSDTSLRVWETTTGATLAADSGYGPSVAITPDGTLVAAGRPDNAVSLMDVATQRVRLLPGHTRSITALAFAPDGATLATGSNDESIRLWDVRARP